jgi:alpha-beta hydrolase superfamily lysophospholipase
MTKHVKNTHEFNLETNDQVSIFVRDWSAPEGMHEKQGIVIMHGLGEHCGRYTKLAEFFLELGFVVRTFDHRGHGQSTGARGGVPNSEAIIEDAKMVIEDFSKQLPEAPMIFAHSMGGLFATHLCLSGEIKIRALILSSPAFAVHLNQFEKTLFAISQYLIPSIGVAHGSNGLFLSHDLEVVKDYQNDELVHNKISARLFKSMLKSMKYIHKNATKLKIAILLLVADNDLIVDSNGSKKFSNKILKNDPHFEIKTILYPNFYHEVINEPESQIVFNDIKEWLYKENLTPKT